MNILPSGYINSKFQEVARVFMDNFAKGLDVGAALCIYYKGSPVVNIWHGEARPGISWSHDTLVPLTSISKTIFASIILDLNQDGVFDLDVPVCEFWPFFSKNGKKNINTRCILSHRAGIPTFNHPISLEEQISRNSLIEELEDKRPTWTPNSKHGYHAITMGFLMTEIIYRLLGEKPKKILEQKLVLPLNLDLHQALKVEDIPRIVRMIPPSDNITQETLVPQVLKKYHKALLNKNSLMHRATFGSTSMTFEDMNNPLYYTAERPTIYATAASTAKFFASLIGEVDNLRFFKPETIEIARSLESHGHDLVFEMPSSWGVGFMLPGGPLWKSFGTRAFGHIGASGAVAFSDPEHSLAFAFLPNKMKSVLECTDRRVVNLINKTYYCLKS